MNTAALWETWSVTSLAMVNGTVQHLKQCFKQNVSAFRRLAGNIQSFQFSHLKTYSMSIILYSSAVSVIRKKEMNPKFH